MAGRHLIGLPESKAVFTRPQIPDISLLHLSMEEPIKKALKQKITCVLYLYYDCIAYRRIGRMTLLDIIFGDGQFNYKNFNSSIQASYKRLAWTTTTTTTTTTTWRANYQVVVPFLQTAMPFCTNEIQRSGFSCPRNKSRTRNATCNTPARNLSRPK